MKDDIYEQIRKNNEIDYGKKGGQKIGKLTSMLYAKKTHFIYEIIQNAEDACNRAFKQNKTRSFGISFYLFKDRIEIRHNGLEFDEKDVIGISNILLGTKERDSEQIGKFGIGFKSVYEFTETPEIYSGDKHFRINDYILPYEINPHPDLKPEDTLIVIPFNSNKVTTNDAFNQIRTFLEHLSPRTIMFLRHINKIDWYVDNIEHGRISKEVKPDGTHKRITLTNEKDKQNELWLMFEKSVKENLGVQISYKLSKDKKTGKEIIVDCGLSDMFVSLPLENKETYLKFLLNGPYNTTATRDQIYPDDEFNKTLIKKTAELVADSLSEIKKLGMLDVNCLSVLPIVKKNFEEGARGYSFNDIFLAVLNKFKSNEALIPGFGQNQHYTSHECCLAASAKLRDLLSSENLEVLLKRKGWVSAEITSDRTPELKEYLMNELDVPEFDYDMFVEKINKSFIEKQDDRWIIKFYDYLNDFNNLNYIYSYNPPQILLKPIIRLQNGDHINPFKKDTIEPQVYLPSKFENDLPTVKRDICQNPQAVAFLNKLKISTANQFDVITEQILPLYKKKKIDVTPEDNYKHVSQIIEVVKSLARSSNDDFSDQIAATPFILVTDVAKKNTWWVRPSAAYFGKEYNKDSKIEEFYGGCPECFLLHPQYLEIGFENLKLLGINTRIFVSKRKPYYYSQNYVSDITITDVPGHHEKGLRGFDPDAYIMSLDFVLKKINLSRAKTLWELIINESNQIQGTVEKSSRQDYRFSTKNKRYSRLGGMLVTNAWIPNKKGVFCKPEDVLLEELHDTLDANSPQSKLVAELLGFKKDETEKQYSSLSPNKQALLKGFDNLDEKKQAEILQKINELASGEGGKSPPTMPPRPEPSQEPQEREDVPTTTPSLTEKIKPLDELIQDSNERLRKIAEYFGSGTPRTGVTEAPPPGADEIETVAPPSDVVKEELENANKEMSDSYLRIRNPNSDPLIYRLRKLLHKQLKEKIRSIHEGNCQVEECKFHLSTINNDTSELEVLFFATYFIKSSNRPENKENEIGNILSLCPNHHYEFRLTVLRPDKSDVPNIEDINGRASRVILKKTDGSSFKLIYNDEHLSKFKRYFGIQQLR